MTTRSVPSATVANVSLDDLRRQGLPFALVGIAALPLGWVVVDQTALTIGAVITLITCIAAMLVPWYRLPSWISVVPPMVALVGVAFLHHGAAGLGASFDLLALLPVVWVALHGSRRDMLLMSLVAGLLILGPYVIIGAPGYPPESWRRAAMMLVVGSFAGLVVQQLVERTTRQAATLSATSAALAASEQASAERAADLGAVLDLARELDGPLEPRQIRDAICEAVCRLAGADSALFFERHAEEDLLTATGGAGIDVRHVVTLDPRASMTGVVMATGRPEFIADLAADPRVDRSRVVDLGVGAAYFEPISDNDGPFGVLIAYWSSPHAELPSRTTTLLELFAVHAANAIERADLQARLIDLARTDALTGLTNRRGLDETLVRDLARARRGHPLSVIMLDLDHFKVFNDTYGHPAGDRLLAAVASEWSSVLRPGDTLARYGGEEFLAILPECGAPEAVAIAERMRALVPLAQTVSAGVAAWMPHEDPASLLGRVDAALYAAKRAGRDRVVTAPTPERSRPHGARADADSAGPAQARRSASAQSSPLPRPFPLPLP